MGTKDWRIVLRQAYVAPCVSHSLRNGVEQILTMSADWRGFPWKRKRDVPLPVNHLLFRPPIKRERKKM